MMACAIVTSPQAASNPYGAPIANFAPSDETIQPYTHVSFTDLTTGNPTSWQWFVNGAMFSTLQNPGYYFTTPGIYAVVLIATNAYGSNSHQHLITIEP